MNHPDHEETKKNSENPSVVQGILQGDARMIQPAVIARIPPSNLRQHTHWRHGTVLIPSLSSAVSAGLPKAAGATGGWLRNSAPVDGLWFMMIYVPVLIGFQLVSTIQGGAGFRNHPQYHIQLTAARI